MPRCPGKGHWLFVVLWIPGKKNMKFDSEGNRNFQRNARTVCHVDTVWYPQSSTLNTSTERPSAASIVHSNIVKLPIQLRCTWTTLPNASIIQHTTGVDGVTAQSGAVMQKSLDIRCLTTARLSQVTWRYSVSSRLVSLRAAVVTVYVQTTQTRKLPTVSQWRFELWTPSIYSRSAGHYNKMFVCPSLHRTDGRPRVTCRTTKFRCYFVS